VKTIETQSGRTVEGEQPAANAYEAPRLVPVGNLNELLAGPGTQAGDMTCVAPTAANPDCM
jgi:hypothetical protein